MRRRSGGHQWHSPALEEDLRRHVRRRACDLVLPVVVCHGIAQVGDPGDPLRVESERARGPLEVKVGWGGRAGENNKGEAKGG